VKTALPEAVRRAAELSNQLAAKAKTGTLTYEDVAMSPQQVQMPAANQPQQMPSGFQPQAAGAGAPGLGTPGFNPQPAEAPRPPTAAGAAQPQVITQPPQPQTPAPPEDPASEQRFRVLQGKYNAEVPRLHQEKKTLEQQNQALQNQLQATQALLAGLAQPPVTNQPPSNQSLVTEKEVKEFGGDLIDVMRRVAREEVVPRVRTLEEQFRPTQQTVQQIAPMVQQTVENSQRTAAELAHERMCNGLDAAVQDGHGNSIWESINQSPDFQAWLDQVDPYSGAKRGAMLVQAYESHDLPRVATFFTGFMKEHAAVAPTGQQQAPTPQGTPPAGTPAVSLASLAAPGTGVGGPVSAGAPNESGQQRVYTQAEIGAFYRDSQRGAYKGREAERAAIERDIFLAQKSGRVRP
jgi:hypothetical protein